MGQLEEKKQNKKRAEARVEAAVRAVESAQRELEAAIAADVEATNQLNDATREASQLEQVERIQKIVHEQCEAAIPKDPRNKDPEKARRLMDQLRGMGVTLDMVDLSWTAPGGLKGAPLRPGAWRCNSCGKIDFRVEPKCYFCGAP